MVLAGVLRRAFCVVGRPRAVAAQMHGRVAAITDQHSQAFVIIAKKSLRIEVLIKNLIISHYSRRSRTRLYPGIGSRSRKTCVPSEKQRKIKKKLENNRKFTGFVRNGGLNTKGKSFC